MKKFLRKTARITLALAPVYVWNMILQTKNNRIAKQGFTGPWDALLYGLVIGNTIVASMTAIDDVQAALKD